MTDALGNPITVGMFLIYPRRSGIHHWLEIAYVTSGTYTTRHMALGRGNVDVFSGSLTSASQAVIVPHEAVPKRIRELLGPQ